MDGVGVRYVFLSVTFPYLFYPLEEEEKQLVCFFHIRLLGQYKPAFLQTVLKKERKYG